MGAFLPMPPPPFPCRRQPRPNTRHGKVVAATGAAKGGAGEAHQGRAPCPAVDEGGHPHFDDDLLPMPSPSFPCSRASAPNTCHGKSATPRTGEAGRTRNIPPASSSPSTLTDRGRSPGPAFRWSWRPSISAMIFPACRRRTRSRRSADSSPSVREAHRLAHRHLARTQRQPSSSTVRISAPSRSTTGRSAARYSDGTGIFSDRCRARCRLRSSSTAETAHRLALVDARVVEVPQLPALLLRVPAVLRAAEAEDAFLARDFSSSRRARRSRHRTRGFVQRLLQRLGLHHVGVHGRAMADRADARATPSGLVRCAIRRRFPRRDGRGTIISRNFQPVSTCSSGIQRSAPGGRP